MQEAHRRIIRQKANVAFRSSKVTVAHNSVKVRRGPAKAVLGQTETYLSFASIDQ